MTCFLFESGPRKGERVTLLEDRVYTVGRAPECDLTIDDELISPVHCKIRGKDGRFYVKDAGSENGTLVNDRRVDVARLEPGDKLLVGTTILTFLGDEQDEWIGRELDGYRLLERLGRGGMGTVYRAEQLSLHRQVALKVLPPELGRDRAFRERFLREARAAAQLNHPHIVQVYDAGEAGGLLFYAMEYVPGGTVEERILRSPGGLPLEEALRYLRDAAQALDYAAGKGIVHRDVKPENLMITELGGVKLADLGLAHPARSDRRERGLFGTPHFLAPEQARGEPVDIRADLYALGATFYRMLTGQTMYHGRTAREIVRKQIHEPPPALRERRPDVPEEVERIYLKLVAKDPAERFQTPSELLQALDGLTAAKSRRALGWLAAAALLAAALSALFWPESGSDAPNAARISALPPDDAQDESNEEEARRAAELERQREALARQARENEAMAELLRLESETDTLAPAEALEKLRAFAERHPQTDAASRALEHARSIEEEIERRRRLEAEAAAAREAAVRALEAAAAESAGEGPERAVAALVDWAGVAPELRSDETVAAARARAAELVGARIERRVAEVAGAARRLLEAGDPHGAEAALEPLRTLAALETDGSADLEPIARALEAARRTLADVSKEAAAARERLEQAKRRSDLLALRYSPVFEEACAAARDHRFGEAHRLLDGLASSLATEPYRRVAQRRADDAREAQRLLAEWATRLAEGSAAEVRIRHPKRGSPARIVAFDPERPAVVLEVRRGAATSRGPVDLAEFPAPEGLVELYLAASPDPARDAPLVARALLLQRLGRLEETARRIAGLLGRYDSGRGWSEELREEFGRLDFPAVSCEALDRALTDAGERAADVAARIAREEAAQDALLTALRPFLEQGDRGFHGTADALAGFCERFADTDTFLALHPVLCGPDGAWEPAP